MRRSVLAAVGFLFFLGAPVEATEVDRPLPAAEVVSAATAADLPVAGELQLTQVNLEERTAVDDAALAQPARPDDGCPAPATAFATTFR